MTSAVVGVTITFDGVDVQQLAGLHLEVTQGLNDSPTVRGVDVTVPAARGQTARPRKFHERRLVLNGWVRGDGDSNLERRLNYRGNVRAMLSVFDTEAAPAPLVLGLEDGATYTADARTLSVLSNEVIQSEFALVNIEVLAVEDWSVVEATS